MSSASAPIPSQSASTVSVMSSAPLGLTIPARTSYPLDGSKNSFVSPSLRPTPSALPLAAQTC